jgi:hypothetical protein
LPTWSWWRPSTQRRGCGRGSRHTPGFRGTLAGRWPRSLGS